MAQEKRKDIITKADSKRVDEVNFSMSVHGKAGLLLTNQFVKNANYFKMSFEEL